MAYFVSKTFEILNIKATPVYNFYAPDEKINTNALIYNSSQYKDEINSFFIKNEHDTSFAARYIKLEWDLVNKNNSLTPVKTRTTLSPDENIQDMVQKVESNEQDNLDILFDTLNVGTLVNTYLEHFLLLNDKNAIVIGNEKLTENELLTDDKVNKCFSGFIRALSGSIKYDRKDKVTPIFKAKNLIDSYCGYVILKEEFVGIESDALRKTEEETGLIRIERNTNQSLENFEVYKPVQYIIIRNPIETKFFDYFVSYDKKYRYRIAPIYKKSYQSKVFKSLSIELNGFNTQYNIETDNINRKEYFIGNFSQYVKTWIEDKSPPNYPEDVRVLPDKETTKKFILLWSHVEQPEKDIKYYTVLRRLNKDNSEWERILETTNYHYIEQIDDNEQYNLKNIGYIYVIMSTDVHGNESLLSKQLLVKMEQKGNKNTIKVDGYLPEGYALTVRSKETEIENEYQIYLNEHIDKIKISPGANFDKKTLEVRLISDIGDLNTYTINPVIRKVRNNVVANIINMNKFAVYSNGGNKVIDKIMTKDLTGVISGGLFDTLNAVNKANEQKEKSAGESIAEKAKSKIDIVK